MTLDIPALTNPVTRNREDVSGWAGYDDAIVINALGYLNGPFEEDIFLERSVGANAASGLTAINITLFSSSGHRKDQAITPYEASKRSIVAWRDFIDSNAGNFLLVKRGHDILDAKASGRVGLMLGFQECSQVAADLSSIAEFAELGARIFQLTYNARNAIADGCLVPDDRGLTELGREAVKTMNGHRVLVDLSHSSDKTFADTIATSSAPVSVTHSGCRALANHPRNRSDQELRALADKGGVVGIYSVPFFLKIGGGADIETMFRHINHAVNICGEDHGGVGTDGSVTPIEDWPAFKQRWNTVISARQANGSNAPGEDSGDYYFLNDLQGVDQFRRLAAYLEKRGYFASRIEKILGGNFLRLMGDVWG